MPCITLPLWFYCTTCQTLFGCPLANITISRVPVFLWLSATQSYSHKLLLSSSARTVSHKHMYLMECVQNFYTGHFVFHCSPCPHSPPTPHSDSSPRLPSTNTQILISTPPITVQTKTSYWWFWYPHFSVDITWRKRTLKYMKCKKWKKNWAVDTLI